MEDKPRLCVSRRAVRHITSRHFSAKEGQSAIRENKGSLFSIHQNSISELCQVAFQAGTQTFYDNVSRRSWFILECNFVIGTTSADPKVSTDVVPTKTVQLVTEHVEGNYNRHQVITLYPRLPLRRR